jgi:hypothetical protein
MNKLKVQEYLETHSLNDLQDEFGIKHKFGPSYNMDRLVKLCYSQIDSKPGPIVDECRGLILENHDFTRIDPCKKMGFTKIVAYPFNRFYNYGQPGQATVDWKTSKFLTKLDGTLIILFYYGGTWHVSTKQVISANDPMNDHGDSFTSLFWEAFYKIEKALNIEMLDKRCTYMFELVGPANQIVVEYPESEIYLLGIRDIHTFKEKDIYKIDLPFALPEFYRYDTIEELMEMVNSRKGKEFEGVVAVDESFNRVKIKNLEYLILHRLNDKASRSKKNMLELILL